MNKKEFKEKVETLGIVKECQKKSLNNIVFPKWETTGLLGLFFRQCIRTKEAPEGHLYDENKFQIVMRILDGKLLMSGMADVYTWTFEQFQKKSKGAKPIGVHSAEGLMALADTLCSVKDREEAIMLGDMFTKLPEDLLLITTPSEERRCVEVTQELYDAGVTYSIDSWAEPNADGEYSKTMLNVGDFLIIEESSAYCIRREEFLLTHKIL